MSPNSPLPDAQLEQVRAVLMGSERAELEYLREQVARLEPMEERVAALERQLLDTEGRSAAVQEVLISAVEGTDRSGAELGPVLKPDIEHGLYVSARDDSGVLADALYPVLGPAIRKMIANMFSPNEGGGQSFRVEQVLLIDRTSGLLLAAAARDEDDLEDADVVSGMLDAIRLFVQDAFDTPDHDGLQDLRVGDTSVLVEWGPSAVLASVVRGIPTENYRSRSASTLEQIHIDHAGDFAEFSGDVTPFEQKSTAALRQLFAADGSRTAKIIKPALIIAFVIMLVVIGVLIGIAL